jgi:hypothetical protein
MWFSEQLTLDFLAQCSKGANNTELTFLAFHVSTSKGSWMSLHWTPQKLLRFPFLLASKVAQGNNEAHSVCPQAINLIIASQNLHANETRTELLRPYRNLHAVSHIRNRMHHLDGQRTTA